MALKQMMSWNNQPIPYKIALRIGWNLPIDVVRLLVQWHRQTK